MLSFQRQETEIVQGFVPKSEEFFSFLNITKFGSLRKAMTRPRTGPGELDGMISLADNIFNVVAG